MKSKRRLLGLAVPVVVVMMLVACLLPASPVSAQEVPPMDQVLYHAKGDNLDLSKAKPGDIIVIRPESVGNFIAFTLSICSTPDMLPFPPETVAHVLPLPWPGDLIEEPYLHTAIYIGDGKLIEVIPFGRIIDANDMVLYADQVALVRVNTSDEVRAAAVDFAIAQLGKPMDPGFLLPLHKPEVYGRYYCTEFVWAAYMVASNGEINLQRDTSPPVPSGLCGPIAGAIRGHIVTPTEIIKSGYCTVVDESPKHYIQ